MVSLGALAATLAGLVFLGIGAIGAWAFVKKWRTDTADAATLPRDRIVKLEGTVKPADATLTAPSGTECVSFSFNANKTGGDPAVDPTGNTIARGRASVPFYLEDATGRVLVDDAPRNEANKQTDDDYIVGSHDLGVGARVFEFAADFDGSLTSTKLTDAITGADDHPDIETVESEMDVLVEHRITPGEELFVQGYAIQHHPTYGEPAVINRDSFTVATSSGGFSLGLLFFTFAGLSTGVFLTYIGLTGLF